MIWKHVMPEYDMRRRGDHDSWRFMVGCLIRCPVHWKTFREANMGPKEVQTWDFEKSACAPIAKLALWVVSL